VKERVKRINIHASGMGVITCCDSGDVARLEKELHEAEMHKDAANDRLLDLQDDFNKLRSQTADIIKRWQPKCNYPDESRDGDFVLFYELPQWQTGEPPVGMEILFETHCGRIHTGDRRNQHELTVRFYECEDFIHAELFKNIRRWVLVDDIVRIVREVL
jgi:hypothetical protein